MVLKEWATSETGATIIGAGLGLTGSSFVGESVASAFNLHEESAEKAGVKAAIGVGLSAGLFYLGIGMPGLQKLTLYGASAGAGAGAVKDLIELAIPGSTVEHSAQVMVAKIRAALSPHVRGSAIQSAQQTYRQVITGAERGVLEVPLRKVPRKPIEILR